MPRHLLAGVEGVHNAISTVMDENETFSWKYLFKMLAISLVIGLLLELFLYNSRYWESKNYNTKDYGVCQTTLSEDGSSTVELKDVNIDVKNIYVDPFADNVVYEEGDTVKVQVSATDEANATYLTLPETELVYGIPESNYIRLHLEGTVGDISLRLKDETGKGAIDGVHLSLNSHRPLAIHRKRLSVMVLIAFLLLLFRPSSPIYKTSLDTKKSTHIFALILVLIINIAALESVAYTFDLPKRLYGEVYTNAQYAHLAEALCEGHPWLGEQPPKVLSEIDNPYDPGARAMALSASGEEYILDLAFYKGKYYCYFGVIPVVLFYLPWYVLTGTALRSGPLVMLLLGLFVPSVFSLLHSIVKRYSLDISLGMYSLLSSVLVASSGMLNYAQMPNNYAVPTICALLFSIIGTTCWLRSSSIDGTPSKGLLVIGSIVFALVMGCRPQFTILVFLAFAIFWRQIANREFFSIKGTTNTLCVILPFIVIGCVLMWYNYIRFENPLDFGAKYNLTGFDMTHRFFNPERFLLGYWEYLFQPLYFTSVFPYSKILAGQFELAHEFQGLIVNEPVVGGFFSLNLVGAFILLLRKTYSSLCKNGLVGIVGVLLLTATVILSIDIQMVGMTLRYMGDFSFLLMLASLLIAITYIENEHHAEVKTITSKTLIVLSIICILINLLSIMASGRYGDLLEANPTIYYLIKYIFFGPLSIR